MRVPDRLGARFRPRGIDQLRQGAVARQQPPADESRKGEQREPTGIGSGGITGFGIERRPQ
jgi:hypothetical protein